MIKLEALWLGLLMSAEFGGFMDAIAGGGGLILVAALFAGLPRESPATLFGTNKLASIFATANAARRKLRDDPSWQ